MIIGNLNTHSIKIGKYSFHEFNYILLSVLIAVSMPFSIQVNSYLIILLSLNWVTEGKWKQKAKLLLGSKYALLWLLFFFFHAISIVYSDNKKEAQFELEKKLSFLVFPLILSTTTFLSKDTLKLILKYFVVSCFCACIICLGNAFLNYFKGDASFFFYHKLGSPLNFHAVYFSMFIGFCIFILINNWFEEHKTLKIYSRIFLIILTCFFITFLLLLSSKTIIVGAFLILTLNVASKILKQKNKWIGISFVFFSLIVISFIIKKTPYINDRFKEIYKENYTVLLQKQDYRNFHFTGGTIRLAIWKSVFDVLDEEKAWLFGVGIGDAQTLLTANYIKKNIYPGDELLGFKGFTHYNAHNQYLQFMITLGLSGFLVFLIILCYSFYIAIKNKETVFISILVLFCAFCFTESVLCAHKGVVFFLFFNSLYCTLYNKNKLPVVTP